MPQFVEELFLLAGKNPKDYFKYAQHQRACNYFWNDGVRFEAPSNPSEYAEKAFKVFSEPKENLLKKFNKAKFIDDRIGKLFLEQSLHKWQGFTNLATAKGVLSIPKLDINKSLHQANTRDLSHPKLVQIFDRYATYNGSNPYQTPGIMGIIPHYEHNVGTFFPLKGMHSITTSLVKLATELGVEFIYNTEVTKIIIQDNKAKGVSTVNRDIEADIVVSNMDVYFTYHKLIKNPDFEPKKTLQAERSSSALIFYWGINASFPELDLHNILFADDYAKEFELIFNGDQPSNDPTIYIHISSKLCKEDAPHGNENWFVMINTPSKKKIDWDQYIEKARQIVIQKISKVLKTDLLSLIVNESILDPRTIESKTMSYEGSLYGTSSNSKYAAFLRHPNFHKKLKNLYFVGGSAHPGGGIPLCLLSAKIATDHVK
jgi:phytoene desaturase